MYESRKETRQHGVATATACALFDMECEVFMGEEDVRRQKPNVDRMPIGFSKVNSQGPD